MFEECELNLFEIYYAMAKSRLLENLCTVISYVNITIGNILVSTGHVNTWQGS